MICSKEYVKSEFICVRWYKVNLSKDNLSKPNILLIGVDQMRYDTLGCNGNTICKTPNINRLADCGVNFTHAYTTASLCSPARASIFTGRFAFRHGMGTNCDMYHSLATELPDPNMLLHRYLLSEGYRCGYVGKWHIGTKKGPVDYGFEGMNIPGYGDIERYDGFIKHLKSLGVSYGPVKYPIYANPNRKTLAAGMWNGPTESTPAFYLADYTIKMLNEYANQTQPFFLTCQFWGPHMPYLPSTEFYGKHNRKRIEPWINYNDDLTDKPSRLRREVRDFYRALPKDWRGWQEIIGCYYDFTSMIDQQIGRILDVLEQLNLSENTIVIFTSDHGDMLGSHGGLFDKGFMYEDVHRIPLIIKFPSLFEGSRTCNDLVYSMDILITVLDIIGHMSYDVDGISLLPALKSESNRNSRDMLYLEFHGLRSLYSQRALVTRDGYKYIFTPGDNDEFYNLNNDPAEINNLIELKEYKPKIGEVREKMRLTAKKYRDPIADYISKLFGKWPD